MATYQLSAPDQFDFTKKSQWPTWLQRFEMLRTASKLSDDLQPRQVDSLIYTMGEKAEDIFKSFNLPDEDSVDYDVVANSFTDHFVDKHNVIYERATFNRRVQGATEIVEQFFTALYSLAENCKYGELRDELICNRLVVGLRDTRLSERLQLDADLTLQRAIEKARQHEQVKNQQGMLHNHQSHAVDAVQRKSTNRHQIRPTRDRAEQSSHSQTRKSTHQSNPATPSRPASGNKCKWCGRSPHARRDCPPKDAICRYCNVKGHYQSECLRRKQTLHTLDSAGPCDDVFMGSVHADTINAPIITAINVGKARISFKIDTGTDVTAISSSDFKRTVLTLSKSQKRLYGAGGSSLDVIGMCEALLESDDRVTVEPIYVVDSLHVPLLGRPAIKNLGLVSYHVESIRSLDDIRERFPKLLRPLGQFSDPYDAVLKEAARPYAISVPRRVPLPLLPKVKAQLQKMQDQGVIRPITEPTDWCAGIVVVPKKTGDIRICVDLTQLNKAIKRERLQLPSEAEVLH